MPTYHSDGALKVWSREPYAIYMTFRTLTRSSDYVAVPNRLNGELPVG